MRRAIVLYDFEVGSAGQVAIYVVQKDSYWSHGDRRRLAPCRLFQPTPLLSDACVGGVPILADRRCVDHIVIGFPMRGASGAST